MGKRRGCVWDGEVWGGVRDEVSEGVGEGEMDLGRVCETDGEEK